MKNPSRLEIETVLRRLKEAFPANGAMELGDAYVSLVAVLLSARTRDEQVLKLMPAFVKRFPNVEALAAAEVTDIIPYVNSIGMYKQKAKNLKGLGERLTSVYGGVVPDSIDELITLPGVGRKTASVILPYIFEKPAIAVDVHVHRVTNRLGWVKTKTPQQTEKKLLELIPNEMKRAVNQVFVKHGRYICQSQKPRCYMCPISDLCPVKNKTEANGVDVEAQWNTIREKERIMKELKESVLDAYGT